MARKGGKSSEHMDSGWFGGSYLSSGRKREDVSSERVAQKTEHRHISSSSIEQEGMHVGGGVVREEQRREGGV